MRSVEFGQNSDVGSCVARAETRPLRRFALDPARLHPALYPARGLTPAQARDLGQKAPHDSFLPFAQSAVLLRLQYLLDQRVDRFPFGNRPTDVPMARQKLFHLG